MFEQIHFFLVILHILSCSYTVENYNTGQLQFNPSPIDFQATTTIENEKDLEEEANLRTFWLKGKRGHRHKKKHVSLKHAKHHAGGNVEYDKKVLPSGGFSYKIANSGELPTHNPHEPQTVTLKSPEPFGPPTPNYKCEESWALLYVSKPEVLTEESC